MRTIPYYLVDAFAASPFGGNAAGVVPLEVPLAEREMQQIARELNQSETAFLLRSASETADFRVRYFTPAEEINFCGHATVASAWVAALDLGWLDKADEVVLETNIGRIPVRFEREGAQLKSVTMTQVAPRVKEVPVAAGEMARLAGIREEDLDERYPIRLGYTGNWHLLIPVKTRRAIDQAKPMLTELAEMNRAFEISTTHLFTFDTEDDEHHVYTRDFCPAIGIPEDPVTGAANGALAGYFILEEILPVHQTHRLKIAQGHAIGRPGTLDVTISPGADGPVIQVGGAAHITAAGTLRL
ncbi:PhzF family phenazine biosynthesis protein [Brevibacillus marinus]|jgi:PhzF family phenazine biosynthesis protein|uniref:PhzF family phenazine biosynthesis protein n=1 Tax=Brevibacillus marinus TaxID=2496837 RepID=UPI000F848092|nr:PhzF family phenazine biosynthesis protein [Brevibacillus marinus]